MNKKNNFWVFTGIFVLSTFLVFCAGYYRKSVSKESGVFNIELTSNEFKSKSRTLVYDIQNEGIPKKLIQPSRISISTGHGSGITNVSEEPVWISVRLTGIEGKTEIQSNSPYFDNKDKYFTHPLNPGEKYNISIDLDLPSEVLYNYLVGKGKIEFFNYKSNKKLGEVPLKIINSKPKNSCCAIDD